jgi:hypothetical protein
LLAAAAIAHLAALDSGEPGCEMPAAATFPEPCAEAAIVNGHEIAEGAARDVALGRKRPDGWRGGRDTVVHVVSRFSSRGSAACCHAGIVTLLMLAVFLTFGLVAAWRLAFSLPTIPLQFTGLSPLISDNA